MGLGSGWSAGARSCGSLRCCDFRGSRPPPAFQGVEGDPAGLGLRLSTGGALLLLWGGDSRGIFANDSLRCGTLVC